MAKSRKAKRVQFHHRATKEDKDNSQQREKKLNGMNLFIQMYSEKLKADGFVKKDTFQEGVYLWGFYTTEQKALYQLKVGPINLHHKKFRDAVERDPAVVDRGRALGQFLRLAHAESERESDTASCYNDLHEQFGSQRLTGAGYRVVWRRIQIYRAA